MTIESALTAALEQREAQRPYDPASNPLAGKTLTDLMGGAGIMKAADHQFAVDPASEPHIVYRAGLKAGKVDRSAKRMAANRQRAERKKQLDDLAASPVVPPMDRLKAAWDVVVPLEPIIKQGAMAKKAWASRMLGSIADDVPSMVIEATVLVLAKSDKDLDLLARAAMELGDQQRRTGRMPGDQVSDAERKDRKDMAKARKWLMGLVNNRLMGALVDAYTSQRNLRWDNLDLIATVMTSINGPDDDAYIGRHKADRAPAFLGTRMASPGRIDGNLLAAALGAAVTDRGLDRLVELLLDPERVRTDGAFSWADNAQAVFLLSPEGGEYVWSLVCKATAHLANPRRARADAARLHVRNVFAFLPPLVMAARDAFDFEVVERRSSGGERVYSRAVEAKATVAVAEEVPWTQRERFARVFMVDGAGMATVARDVPVTKGKKWTGVRTVERSVQVSRRHPGTVIRQDGDGGLVAMLRSTFEEFGGDRGNVEIARPALAFATPQEAARVLTEHLAVLVNGEDVVSSVVFA